MDIIEGKWWIGNVSWLWFGHHAQYINVNYVIYISKFKINFFRWPTGDSEERIGRYQRSVLWRERKMAIEEWKGEIQTSYLCIVMLIVRFLCSNTNIQLDKRQKNIKFVVSQKFPPVFNETQKSIKNAWIAKLLGE